MKKLILLTGIVMAGTVNAKTISPKAENDKKEIISESEFTKTLETAALKNVQCATFYASCTSAYTCQNWTIDQWYNWAAQIQYNYCQL